MVVWVFAGGGEAEVAGLINFLRKNFNTSCRFERRTPIKNKRGNPLTLGGIAFLKAVTLQSYY